MIISPGVDISSLNSHIRQLFASFTFNVNTRPFTSNQVPVLRVGPCHSLRSLSSARPDSLLGVVPVHPFTLAASSCLYDPSLRARPDSLLGVVPVHPLTLAASSCLYGPSLGRSWPPTRPAPPSAAHRCSATRLRVGFNTAPPSSAQPHCALIVY